MNGSGESYGAGAGVALAAAFYNYSYGSNDTEADCEYESEEDEFDIAFRFYMNGVLLNVIGAFGIVGNVISMIILSRPQMRSSINYLLIGLARCDTVLIVTSILLFGLTGLYPYTKLLHDYYYYVYPHITLVVYPLACVAQTVSVYLTLTVTVERFVAVCHPLRARSLCTYGRARCYVLGIVIFSFLYNMPKFLETEVVSASHRVHGSDVTIYCVQAAPFRNDLYVTVYIHWMYLIFMYILPFASLAILNALIYKQVRRANAERQRLSRIQRREIGLATMLLIVVLVFFACNLLALVTNTLESFSAGPLTVLNPLVKTSNLLVTINSSVNFVIYVIFGEKFKRLFLKIFCAHGLLAAVGGGRESPDAATHDDSLVSNGDRYSVRLHRHNTACSKNGSLHLANNNGVSAAERRSLRVSRAPSPGPVVYYPRQHRLQRPGSYSTALTADPDTTTTQF